MHIDTDHPGSDDYVGSTSWNSLSWQQLWFEPLACPIHSFASSRWHLQYLTGRKSNSRCSFPGVAL